MILNSSHGNKFNHKIKQWTDLRNRDIGDYSRVDDGVTVLIRSFKKCVGEMSRDCLKEFANKCSAKKLNSNNFLKN